MRNTVVLVVMAILVAVLLGTVNATLPATIPASLRSSTEQRHEAARQLARDLYRAATGKELESGRYINLLWQEADVIKAGGKELLVGLTVIPEEGYLGLYAKTAGGYKLLSYVPNLSAIEKIEAVSTSRDMVEVAVTDLYDERLGAFFVQRAIRLYRWNDKTRRLHQVWDAVVLCDEYSLDPPLAEKQITKGTYSFGDGCIELTQTITNWKREGEDYRQTGQTTTRKKYVWNQEQFRFVSEE